MSEQQGIYGIDLGTTYSVVAYIDETGRPAVVRNTDGEDTTPSVVYFENAENTVVGKTAKEAAGFRPDDVVSLIKREMGNKDYTRTFYGQELSPSGISGIILAGLANSAEEETHRPVRQVVITVPAYFGLLEKDATKKAGEIAGLEVIGIVPEPVAAALAYGVTGSADGTTFLVYDLGGGTFDITLIKMTDSSVEVLAVDGDHKLGGADWDARLFEYLKDQTIEQTGDDSIEDDEASLQELRRLAEDTKKALTKAESKKVNHRLAGGMATSITVTRQQFEEMTSDLLEATITITNRMLAKAEEQFPGVRGQINDFLLVGGSSKMPAVAERVRKEFRVGAEDGRPRPRGREGRGPLRGGADGQARRGGSRQAPAPAAAPARERCRAPRRARRPSRPIAASTGLEAEQVEKLAGKTIVNVLPKAVGIKLADGQAELGTRCPMRRSSTSSTWSTRRPSSRTRPRSSPPAPSRPTRSRSRSRSGSRPGAVPDPALSANHRVDNAGLIEGLGSFRLPAGSPIDITFEVDGEGTVNLLAVEPTSGKQLKMSVKIAIMSDEQVAQEKAIVSALRKGM